MTAASGRGARHGDIGLELVDAIAHEPEVQPSIGTCERHLAAILATFADRVELVGLDEGPAEARRQPHGDCGLAAVRLFLAILIAWELPAAWRRRGGAPRRRAAR